MSTSVGRPSEYVPGTQPPPPPAPPSTEEQAYLRRSPWNRMVDRELDLLDANQPRGAAVPGVKRSARPSASTAVAEAAKGRSRSISHEFVTRPRRDLFGLALSGGGIRSATFNLGLLQGLHSTGILRAFDYLSTVSGGGYIGAFWSAWMARDPEQRSGDFPNVGSTSRAECPEVEHLRRFSNFLSPRVGIFSYDTGRMIVALLGGMVPSLLASISVILGALYGWLIVAQFLFASRLGITFPSSDAAARAIPGSAGGGALVGALALFLIAIIVLFAAEASWRTRGEPARWSRYALAAVLGAAISASAWWAIGRGVASPYLAEETATAGWLSRLPIVGGLASAQRLAALVALLAPAAASAAGALVLLFWRVGASRFSSALGARARSDVAGRVASRLLFVAAAWVVVSLVWFGGAYTWEFSLQHGGMTFGALAAAVTALSGAFGKVQRLTGEQPNKAMGATMASRLRRRLPQILAYVVLLAIACSTALLIVAAASHGWPGTLVVAAAAVTLFVLVAFDPNEIGLHSFYRGRLARAYLGASNPVPMHTAEVRDGDDVEPRAMERQLPLHVVCCAANDLDSSDPIATLRRGAMSAVVSPAGFSVGSDAVCWCDAPPDVELPSLATAITASGAAFNSQMGSKSMELGPAVTYLMATFNLRLGLWLPHPTWAGWTSRDWRARATGTWLPGRAFYRELFGRSSVDAPRVHLSDGGHFENMALFELLRRHCRYVIASDCGADPDVAFDDFGNLVRRAREDLGVEIAIDLSPLRPGSDGFARQQMVAGDIHYPNGDVGVLLMFKPTLTGDEPVDVRQYHDRNREFPHESTGDQFYDEAQWEAYRRLGLHASRSAFRAVMDGVEEPLRGGNVGRTSAASVFANARRQWLPAPVAIHERIERLTSRAAELEGKLIGSGTEDLRYEVYRELAALNGDSPRDPTSTTLGMSLDIVRDALRFMEEAFVCEELESRGDHPVYLGLMNYFGRWSQSPTIRAWWPLLRPMHSKRFARYLDIHFGMVPRDPRGIYATARVSDEPFTPSDPNALAAQSWARERRGGLVPGKSKTALTLSFLVPIATPLDSCEIQVGQLIVRVSNALLSFDAGDFYVAPSFWGAGIGEAFLTRLTNGEGTRGAKDLLVRIPGTKGGGSAALKRGADLTQMYRAAGFREVWPAEQGGWKSGDGRVELPDAMRGEGNGGARWLWRRVDSRR